MVAKCTAKRKSNLQQEFVNEYRHTWGTSTGLSTAKLKKMTCRELERGVRSLRDFREMGARR